MVLFCTGIYAQELTLEQAVELSLKKSEDIQQAQVAIERAEAQIKQAWGTVFPHISANVQAIRHTKSPVMQFNGMSVPVKQDWEMLSTLQLTQAIFSFGKVSNALDLAKLSKKFQFESLQAVKREIRFATEVAYYNVLLAEKVLQITKDSLNNAKNNQRALLRRFQGGRVPRFDNIKMESDVASRVPMVSDAEKSLKLAYLQLNLLTEMNSNSRPKLTTSMRELFPALSSGDLLNEAYQAPSIKATQLAVQMAESQAKLANADHYPTVSAFGTITHNGTGTTMPPEEENMFTSTSVGLMINIPIFEGGSVSARHQQAVLEKTRAQIELKKQKENLEMELVSAVAEYTSNIEKFVSAKKAVALSKQAYDLTVSRFETGGATRTDLNDSERSLTNARIQQETTLFQIYRNQASIKRFTQQVVAQ